MRFIDGLGIIASGYDNMDAKYPAEVFRQIHANNGLTINDIANKTGFSKGIINESLEFLTKQKLIRMSISPFGEIRFHSRIANSQMSIMDW